MGASGSRVVRVPNHAKRGREFQQEFRHALLHHLRLVDDLRDGHADRRHGDNLLHGSHMIEGYLDPIRDEIKLIRNRLDMLEAKGNSGVAPVAQLTLNRINFRLDELEKKIKQPVPAPLASMRITPDSSN